MTGSKVRSPPEAESLLTFEHPNKEQICPLSVLLQTQ